MVDTTRQLGIRLLRRGLRPPVNTGALPRRVRGTGQNGPMTVRALLLAGLAALLAGCGDASSGARHAKLPGAGKPAVTLATKNFTEEFVLGQLYKQALEAK